MPIIAVIIGAGPAGLTAAYEFLKRTDIVPILIEKSEQVGGISKTIEYKGNRMDFGPHRFFSKSDRVMEWWTNIMPIAMNDSENLTINYHNQSKLIQASGVKHVYDEKGDTLAKSMLVLPRLTRIFFLRQFFNYPIQLTAATLGKLGLTRTVLITLSYLSARIFPKKPENTLEDFMINRFGKVLYKLFFKDYTEKVWGVPCRKISAEWGAQRIKGVSLSKALIHAAQSLVKKGERDIVQKSTETSLIEKFLYPAKGAGAMWEEVARQIQAMGAKILTCREVKTIITKENNVIAIEIRNIQTGEIETMAANFFLSSMPVQELIANIQANVPTTVKQVASGLVYRDFVYAGILVKRLAVPPMKDNWIYIQEKNVKVARIQIYNNWGPYMVNDPATIWLGMEYFCTKGDDTWAMTNDEIKELAIDELIKLKLVNLDDVMDATVERMEKTYPSYTGSYSQFNVIRNYLDGFSNLYLIGRNGMHKYNNADHSMLTAMVTVDNIVANKTDKSNIWDINTEEDYQE